MASRRTKGRMVAITLPKRPNISATHAAEQARAAAIRDRQEAPSRHTARDASSPARAPDRPSEDSSNQGGRGYAP